MKEHQIFKLSDIKTGTSFFKSRFVLNTKKSKPNAPKFVLEKIKLTKKQILKSMDLNGMELDPMTNKVRYKNGKKVYS